VCGLERLFEGADLVTVTPFEFGELGGEGANDAARGFVGYVNLKWPQGDGLKWPHVISS